MPTRRSPNERAPARFLDLTSRLRGIYERVARQLELDPSYVSRVARGERRSNAVKAALRKEIETAIRGVKKVGRKKKK